jgi:hypothetical protein
MRVTVTGFCMGTPMLSFGFMDKDFTCIYFITAGYYLHNQHCLAHLLALGDDLFRAHKCLVAHLFEVDDVTLQLSHYASDKISACTYHRVSVLLLPCTLGNPYHCRTLTLHVVASLLWNFLCLRHLFGSTRRTRKVLYPSMTYRVLSFTTILLFVLSRSCSHTARKPWYNRMYCLRPLPLVPPLLPHAVYGSTRRTRIALLHTRLESRVAWMTGALRRWIRA